MVVLFLAIIVLLGLILYLGFNGNLEGFLVSSAIELVFFIAHFLYGKFKFYKYGFKLKMYEIFKPNLEIRISASYLYRIEIKGKYLLVKNARRNVFQPVGGVYKFYNSAKNFLNSIEYKPDDKIDIDNTNVNDLRIRIKAKYLTKFLNWFYSEKDRETDYNREFQEELVETSILSQEFKKIKSKLIKTIKSKIEYSHFFNCYELKPKDIIEIELSDKQYNELFNKSKEHSDMFKFATEEEILSNGIDKSSQEIKFADHTKYIL